MSFSPEVCKEIRVLVVDDHTLFAEGTVSLLHVEPRILVVGVAKTGMECMNFITKISLDVVLLDINLPDTCGTDLIEKIKIGQPKAKILMLTGQNPKGYVAKSRSEGANGFLLKDCSVKEMTQAIFRVYEGSDYFTLGLDGYLQPPNISADLNSLVKSEKTPSELLTTREIEIIELVSKGLHNKEIAAAIDIKVRTVDFHVSNILFKLGVSTRLEAVLQWVSPNRNIL